MVRDYLKPSCLRLILFSGRVDRWGSLGYLSCTGCSRDRLMVSDVQACVILYKKGVMCLQLGVVDWMGEFMCSLYDLLCDCI